MTNTPFNAKNGIIANGSFIANSTQITIPTTAKIIANGSAGTSNNTLYSNGTGVFWAPIYTGGNTQYIFSNTTIFNNTVIANAQVQFVGNNGIQFSDNTYIETARSLSFRNMIVNGGFWIDQLNTGISGIASLTSLSNAEENTIEFTCDHWYTYYPVTAGPIMLGKIVASANTQLQYMYQLTAFNGSVANVSFGNKIEACNMQQYLGTNTTLSFWVSSPTVTSIVWSTYYCNAYPNDWAPEGTVGVNASGANQNKTLISNGTITVNNSHIRNQLVIPIPLAAANGLCVEFFMPSITGGSTINFGGVQWEAGTVATPFEVPPYNVILNSCQRYLKVWRDDGSNTMFGTGFFSATNQVLIYMPTYVQMMANNQYWLNVGTSGESATLRTMDGQGGSLVNGSANISSFSSNSNIVITVNTSGSSTTGNPTFLVSTSANAFVYVQCEF